MEYVTKQNAASMSSDKKWTQSSIRSLRLRLGWSQAEFARRLSLDPADVEFMEEGVLAPNPGLRGELEIIERQADANCEEKLKSAQSDCELHDRL